MAFKLLDAATATGESPSIAVREIMTTHSLQVIATGSPTTVTVALQGSLDGSNWHNLDSSNYSNGQIVSVADAPVRFVRANLSALTGGTAPTVTVLYEGARADR